MGRAHPAYLIAVLLLGWTAQSCLDAGEIRTAPLDPSIVTDLRVSSRDPLTLVFPFELTNTALVGGDVTTDPEEFFGSFLVTFNAGSNVMNMRALEEGKEAFINVLDPDNRVYVFRLIQSNTRNDSSVTMVGNRRRSSRGFGGFANSSQDLNSFGPGASPDYSPDTLAKYMDRTFNYPLLKRAGSELIDNSEEVGIKERMNFVNGVNFELESVVRWSSPHPDIIVFNGFMVNPKSFAVYYDRHSLGVAFGSKVVFASIAHASGVVSANDKVPIQFAITRQAFAELDAVDLRENEFRMVVTFEKSQYLNADGTAGPEGNLPRLGSLPGGYAK